MRCGTGWSIGLVDAIAQARQTTVRCVIEQQRICDSRNNITLNSKSIFRISTPLSFAMSLSGFEIAVGRITSIPLSSSLVLLLYKPFGEK